MKQILDDLAQRGGVEIQDLNALAQVGITGREFIRLQLPDPTLRDALTEALWKTGRINEVDVQVDGKTVKLLPRVKANAG